MTVMLAHRIPTEFQIVEPSAIMTSRKSRLRNTGAAAGKVWNVAAGVLTHGLLRSHRSR